MMQCLTDAFNSAGPRLPQHRRPQHLPRRRHRQQAPSLELRAAVILHHVLDVLVLPHEDAASALLRHLPAPNDAMRGS